MPRYSIRLTNSEFQAQDDSSEYESLDDAVQAGIGSAVDIVRDIVSNSRETSATVEVGVLEGDSIVARRIITISTLLPADD